MVQTLLYNDLFNQRVNFFHQHIQSQPWETCLSTSVQHFSLAKIKTTNKHAEKLTYRFDLCCVAYKYMYEHRFSVRIADDHSSYGQSITLQSWTRDSATGVAHGYKWLPLYFSPNHCLPFLPCAFYPVSAAKPPFLSSSTCYDFCPAQRFFLVHVYEIPVTRNTKGTLNLSKNTPVSYLCMCHITIGPTSHYLSF